MSTTVNIKNLIDKVIIINVDGSKTNESITHEVAESLLKAINSIQKNQESSSDKFAQQFNKVIINCLRN